MSRARELLGHPFWQALLAVVLAYLLFAFGVAYLPPLVGIPSAPVPRSVRLVSNTPRRFDLRLELSQVDLNPSLDPATFRVVVPPGTESMSIEDLRAGGPLSK